MLVLLSSLVGHLVLPCCAARILAVCRLRKFLVFVVVVALGLNLTRLLMVSLSIVVVATLGEATLADLPPLGLSFLASVLSS